MLWGSTWAYAEKNHCSKSTLTHNCATLARLPDICTKNSESHDGDCLLTLANPMMCHISPILDWTVSLLRADGACSKYYEVFVRSVFIKQELESRKGREVNRI